MPPLLRWLVWKSLEMCPFLVSMTRSKHAIEAKGNQTPLFVVCGVERRVTNGGRLCVCSMSKRINCTLCTYSLVEAVWSSCGFTPWKILWVFDCTPSTHYMAKKVRLSAYDFGRITRVFIPLVWKCVSFVSISAQACGLLTLSGLCVEENAVGNEQTCTDRHLSV